MKGNFESRTPLENRMRGIFESRPTLENCIKEEILSQDLHWKIE